MNACLVPASFPPFQGYLCCEHVEARLAAVDCCLKVLLPFVRIFEKGDDKQRKNVLPLIKEVLTKLANVAVADPGPGWHFASKFSFASFRRIRASSRVALFRLLT